MDVKFKYPFPIPLTDIGRDFLGDLKRAVADDLFKGSMANRARVQGAFQAIYLGRNGYGDDIYDLGRKRCEHRPKRLYVTTFARTSRSGAIAKINIANAP